MRPPVATAGLCAAMLLSVSGMAADVQGDRDWPAASAAETAHDPWIAGLRDPDGRVRGRTVVELRARMEPRYVEPVAALLDDESPQVRYAALCAIGEVRERRRLACFIAHRAQPRPAPERSGSA